MKSATLLKQIKEGEIKSLQQVAEILDKDRKANNAKAAKARAKK